ncbi:MAG: efflux RND transporter periplasmic adaptor subunit [Phycisphaerae bacterium]
MKSTVIKLAVVGLIVAAAGGVGWYWYDYYQSQQRTHTVGTGPVTGTMFSGIVRCANRTRVSAEVAATVEKWHVSEGDLVQSDQVLVTLDNSLIAEDHAQAQARVERVAAFLEELETGARPEQKTQLQQALMRATAEYNHAVREWNRYKDTAPAGGATNWEVEIRKTRAMVAKTHMEQAQAGLELLEKGTRSEQLAQARAELKLARAELARINALRSKYTLRARHAGKVTKTYPQVNELVAVGQPLLLLHDFSSVEVDGYCPETLQSRVQMGGKAVVQADAFPGMTFDATVRQILPRVDETRGTVTVRLSFDAPPDVELPHGGTVDITLLHDGKQEVVRVPVEAVEGAGDQAFVRLKQGSGFLKQPVTTGSDDGRWIEITDGLRVGQTIGLR